MALSTTSPNAGLPKAGSPKAGLPKATLIVPVLNAEVWLPALLKCLTELVNTGAYQCIIIDSASTDATPVLCQACPEIEFISIQRSEFNHGGTRNLAISKAQANILVYLSQDALPTPAAVELLVNALINQPASEEPQLAAAYGRQLPNATAQPFGAHLRAFNYPSQSYLSTPATLKERGIKAAFLSNAFCAYNKQALNAVGQFPADTIIGEDFIVGAKLLKAGYSLAYIAQATAIHSHDYTPWQELKRYFDIGCMHQQQAWVFTNLARPEKAGRAYVLSEIRWLKSQGLAHKVPASLLRSLLKLLGYKLGKNHRLLPNKINQLLSMNRSWWVK